MSPSSTDNSRSVNSFRSNQDGVELEASLCGDLFVKNGDFLNASRIHQFSPDLARQASTSQFDVRLKTAGLCLERAPLSPDTKIAGRHADLDDPPTSSAPSLFMTLVWTEIEIFDIFASADLSQTLSSFLIMMTTKILLIKILMMMMMLGIIIIIIIVIIIII